MIHGDEHPGATGPGPGGAATAAAADPAGPDPERARERPARPDPPLARDPAAYTLDDEPLADGAAVDYRFLYRLVLEQLDREDERGRALDTKLATLLAGVVAGIGFAFHAAPTRETAMASLLYVVPLVMIVLAYTTRLSRTAPRPDALAERFPAYPVTTLKAAVEAMVDVYRYDRDVHATKATLFDVAALITAIVTAAELAAQAHGTLR